jgi:hypothetical protein
MHTHSIDFNLPLGLGRLKATIDHRPYDDENILVIITPEILPTFAKFLPRNERTKTREVLVKRSFVRLWGNNLNDWADEPAPGAAHE